MNTDAKLDAACPLRFRTDSVTVYEDRADIVRVADVDVDAGAHVWVFEGLSPLIDADRLVCRVVGAAHVDDVHIDRVVVDASADAIAARRRERHEQRARLADELRVVSDAHRVAQTAFSTLKDHFQTWKTSTQKRLGRGIDVDVDADFNAFAAALADADRDVSAKKAAVDAVVKRQEALNLEETRPAPSSTKRICHVTVRVAVHEKGPVRVVLSTVVPCAAWRPSHEASLARAAALSSTAGTVRFVTQGTVWNNTGEAWRGARLLLSTARPALGAELPDLNEDRLRLRTKTPEEKKTIRVEHRTERVPQSAQQGGAPGVDDGGEARAFTVDVADIESDGRPRQFPLAHFEAPCALAQLAVPEQSRVVFVRASFKNVGATPILAGPVTLKDGGAWAGVGDILFCGAGDDVDLCFGSNDRVSVALRKHVLTDKKLVGKDIKNFVQEVTLTSTAKTPEAVVVQLRLPVSELQQVKVVQAPHHGSEGEVVVDAHGIARLPVLLPPGGEKRLAVAFSFDAGSDVSLPDPWS